MSISWRTRQCLRSPMLSPEPSCEIGLVQGLSQGHPVTSWSGRNFNLVSRVPVQPSSIDYMPLKWKCSIYCTERQVPPCFEMCQALWNLTIGIYQLTQLAGIRGMKDAHFLLIYLVRQLGLRLLHKIHSLKGGEEGAPSFFLHRDRWTSGLYGL